MTQPVPILDRTVAERLLRAVNCDAIHGDALVIFPAVLKESAEQIAEALRAIGIGSQVILSPEEDFQALSPEQAAARWVPPPGPETPALLVLYGAQPWETPFDEDYRIELVAMKNREALKASGQRILFLEWPRGARRDAEVDLSPSAMAEIFRRSLDINYEEMRRWNAELLQRFQGSAAARIQCPEGTELRVSIQGRDWIGEDCVMGEVEPAVYLPGGEVYVPVVENSAQGQVAFRFCGERRVASFVDGLLTSIVGPDGEPDLQLEEELAAGSEPLCELGVGTNTWSPPWQIGTLYEKSAGTVHVAVGGNAHFGGRRDSPRHADLIIRTPRLWVDDQEVVLPRADWGQLDPRGGRPQ